MRKTVLFLTLLAGGVVHAASFDCAKAHTHVEKAVCTSSHLSQADEQVAAAYHVWLAAARPEWREGIRATQRDWARSRDFRCGRDETSTPLQDCLSVVYAARLHDLRQMVQHRDGILFVWRAIVLTARDEPGSVPLWGHEVHPGFGTLEASWPQAIVDTPQAQAWNQAIEAATRQMTQSPSASADAMTTQWKAEADVDSETTVSIDAVSKDLVATTLQGLWDGHGAHPNHGTTQFNWLLGLKREVKSEDVFVPGSGWQALMQQRLGDYLHKTLDAEMLKSYEQFLPPGGMAKVLHGIAVDPRRWQLDGRGLTLIFQPYEVACYACTPPPMTISWTDLKPYLQPAFALPR